MKYKAGIIGATGYAGVELVRLLLRHPHAEIAAISSVSYKGQKISEVYPALAMIYDAVLEDEQAVIDKSDVIFGSLPHGLSENIALQCEKSSKIFIDLGADFRLQNEEEYLYWYENNFQFHDLHKKAVYALPELNREEIKNKTIIANPGCYPTSVALGLVPAVSKGIIENQSIIIDSKSGVSGAGRTPTQTAHFPECNEAFAPYKTATHRHTPEIEQTLSRYADEKVYVTFVPHLLPINRGILTTIYANLKTEKHVEEIHAIYENFYKNEAFVRIMPIGQTSNVKYVRYSNYCNISLHIDQRTGRLIVVSAIDNMVKGAAGQAIQNMNIVLGIAEKAGLEMSAPCV